MLRLPCLLLLTLPMTARARPDVTWTWYEVAIEGDRVRAALDMPAKHAWTAEQVAARPAEDPTPEALIRLERFETLGALRWSVRHGVSAWQSGPSSEAPALSVTADACTAAWRVEEGLVREALGAFGPRDPCLLPEFQGATLVAEKFVDSARTAGTVYRSDERGPAGGQELLVESSDSEVWMRALYASGAEPRALRGLRWSEPLADLQVVQLPGGLALVERLDFELPSPVDQRSTFRTLPVNIARVEVRRRGAPPLTLSAVPLPERPSVRLEKLDSVTRMNQAGAFWVDVLDAGGGPKLVGRVGGIAKLTLAAVHELDEDSVTVAVAKDAPEPRDYIDVQYAGSEHEGIARVIAESLRLALPAVPIVVSEGNPAKASVVIEVGK